MDFLTNFNFNTAFEEYSAVLVAYVPKVIGALLVLYFGFKFTGFVKKKISNILVARNIDPSLSVFLSSIVDIIFKAVIIVSAIDMMGIKTTSFIAILGAAGLAVGLALQGSLSNFAGGVLILLFRPFKTGDYIIAQGEEGTVQKIDVFNTWLNKLDNRRVILPNGALASGTIVNVSAEDIRRVDFTVGVSYTTDIKVVRDALIEVAGGVDLVLKDQEIFVGIKEFGDSSVNFTFRVWCKTPDYWAVFFAINEKIKKDFDAKKIEIPFPQRDVHLYNQDSK